MRWPNDGTIDIACLWGNQQQTHSTLQKQLIDGTDNEQMDRQTPYHFTDPATYYLSSVNKIKLI